MNKLKKSPLTRPDYTLDGVGILIREAVEPMKIIKNKKTGELIMNQETFNQFIDAWNKQNNQQAAK